jgi:hypothetical protein
MLLRAAVLGASVVMGLALPAMAQTVSCDTFDQDANGRWVALTPTTIQGSNGPIQVQPGQPVGAEATALLNRQCK